MKKIVYNLILPTAFIAALLSSIIAVSLNRNFYDKQYTHQHTAEFIGISHENLMLVTDQLLDYICNKAENIDMQYDVNGIKTEIFDENEKLHMIDVQKLFMNVIYINIILISFVIISSVCLIKFDGFKTFRTTLRKKYKYSIISLAVFSVILIFIFTTNFDLFWTYFHRILFTNDLWLLDPAVSIMINMFPLKFFINMCFTILCTFVIICIFIYILLIDKIRLKK